MLPPGGGGCYHNRYLNAAVPAGIHSGYTVHLSQDWYLNMHGPKQHGSWEKPASEPNTDQPSYDTNDESSPRLEGDTSDEQGREELD
jgi:hypothetical protein